MGLGKQKTIKKHNVSDVKNFADPIKENREESGPLLNIKSLGLGKGKEKEVREESSRSLINTSDDEKEP